MHILEETWDSFKVFMQATEQTYSLHSQEYHPWGWE